MSDATKETIYYAAIILAIGVTFVLTPWGMS
ncbi:unknown [Roseburia sp. CAG:309]|nr:unknown [Roseburia sp. CAG:309]